MTLSNETKQLIRKEYEEFKESMYAGKSLKERQELDQFFTPPEISIRLIEELSDLSGNILDPTCGSGNLLAAALLAGADPTKVFGNDYDSTMVKECRKRLQNINSNVQDWQVHQGNALHRFALTYFGEDYEEMYFNGCTQKAARNRKLNDEKYDAYVDSSRFKKKYPADSELIEANDYTNNQKRMAEEYDAAAPLPNTLW